MRLITVCFGMVTVIAIVLYFGLKWRIVLLVTQGGSISPMTPTQVVYKLYTWVGDKESKPNTCVIPLMTWPMCYLSFATGYFTVYLDVPV